MAKKKAKEMRRRKPRRRKSAAQGGEARGAQEGERQRPAASRASKPYGQAGKALDGVRILDFTHVQSGPTCTQLLAWYGRRRASRSSVPASATSRAASCATCKGADSLYFTMLNDNKRSITIDSKHPQGQGDPRCG